MNSISFFTKYSTQGASSRYRHFNYFQKLQSLNYSMEIDSFLDTEYLIKLYAKQPISKRKIFFNYLKRLFSVMRTTDNLIIEYELFPYLPFFFEKLCLRNKSYILNFDDNVWDNYKDNFFLKAKYDALVKNAAGVIVANSFLHDKIKHLNNNLIRIPTTIDLEDFNTSEEKFEHFTLVWIGTSVTYRYILSHRKIFQELAKRIDYRLLIIASKTLESEKINGVVMEFVDWSSSTEVSYLQRSHVGVMPLNTDTFSQGKSSFKLIQYLAAGIPLVGSAVGENKRVIQKNINGFLVSSENEWIESIELLYKDATLRKDFSENSKKGAYEYSIQKYFPIYREFIKKTFS